MMFTDVINAMTAFAAEVVDVVAEMVGLANPLLVQEAKQVEAEEWFEIPQLEEVESDTTSVVVVVAAVEVAVETAKAAEQPQQQQQPTTETGKEDDPRAIYYQVPTNPAYELAGPKPRPALFKHAAARVGYEKLLARYQELFVQNGGCVTFRQLMVNPYRKMMDWAYDNLDNGFFEYIFASENIPEQVQQQITEGRWKGFAKQAAELLGVSDERATCAFWRNNPDADFVVSRDMIDQCAYPDLLCALTGVPMSETMHPLRVFMASEFMEEGTFFLQRRKDKTNAYWDGHITLEELGDSSEWLVWEMDPHCVVELTTGGCASLRSVFSVEHRAKEVKVVEEERRAREEATKPFVQRLKEEREKRVAEERKAKFAGCEWQMAANERKGVRAKYPNVKIPTRCVAAQRRR